jgi:hypothetical protein
VLPWPTAFSSANWVDRSARLVDAGNIGEVGGVSRPWVNGSAPSGVPRGVVCGSPGPFLSGFPLGIAGSRPYALPSCCGLPACKTWPSPWPLTIFARSAGFPTRVLGNLTSASQWGELPVVLGSMQFICGPPFPGVDQLGVYNGVFFPTMTLRGYDSSSDVFTYVDTSGLVSPAGTLWTVSKI